MSAPSDPPSPASDDSNADKAAGSSVVTPALLLWLAGFILLIGGCEHYMGWSLPSKRHPIGRQVDPDMFKIWLGLAAVLLLAAGALKLRALLKRKA